MPAGLVSIHKAQASFSEDAVLTTSYLDDNIVSGRIFDIGITVQMTATTPIYFTSELTDPSAINALFLLPIEVNPTEGYVILNIYEDTLYTGGTVVTPTNRNRSSGITPKVTVKTGATGVDKGNLLSITHVYGVAGTNQSAGGGDGVTSNSLVLDLTKRYLYEFTCSETGIVGINAEFGEV